MTNQSRALIRPFPLGSESFRCASCKQSQKASWKAAKRCIIANVYEDGVWKRVEYWHPECYEAEQPYGPAKEDLNDTFGKRTPPRPIAPRGVEANDAALLREAT